MKFLMASVALFSFSIQAAETMKLNFKNEELSKIVDAYSKATGKKFQYTPNLRGKATILNPADVSTEEAFNQISAALATQSYSIVKHDDLFLVKHAREAQRDLIEVSSEVPNLKPERMYTWIVNLKYQSASTINTELRMLTSRDGELSALVNTNQLIVTDWTPNIIRIAEMIKQIDKPSEVKK